MKSIKRFGILGSTALVALLGTIGTSAMAQTLLSAPVTVTNTSSNPVPVDANVINNGDHPIPVRIAEPGVTQNVNVTNGPLSVQNINDPAANAITFTGAMESAGACTSSLNVNLYTVPSGQRLAVESINMGGAIVAAAVGNPNTSTDPINTGYFELIINSPTGPNGGYIYYYPVNALPLANGYRNVFGSFPGKIYADPGSTLIGAFCTVFATGGGLNAIPASYKGPTVTGLRVTFSGYLVNTP